MLLSFYLSPVPELYYYSRPFGVFLSVCVVPDLKLFGLAASGFGSVFSVPEIGSDHFHQRVLNEFSQSCDPPHQPFPPFLVSKLDRRHTRRPKKRDNLLMGEGKEGVGGGAKLYEGEKAWSCIIYSILSDST